MQSCAHFSSYIDRVPPSPSCALLSQRVDSRDNVILRLPKPFGRHTEVGIGYLSGTSQLTRMGDE